MMSVTVPAPNAMSPYERDRWEELQAHWEKKAKRRRLMTPRARAALAKTSEVSKATASKAGRAFSDATPEKVKDLAESAVGAALVPTVQGVVRLLELLNEWVVELTDPEAVLKHHRDKGREVATLQDLQNLDLEHLDELTHWMALRWGTLGAGQGASFGALAMIPVPGVGAAAAITLDLVAMQVLTAAIATRVCYAYGFDAADPAMRQEIDRMVKRGYQEQVVSKVGPVWNSAVAFDAAKGRVNWSKKLREDHRLMAAVESLLKRAGNGGHVPVKNARMGMPFIGVIAGAATNSYVLADTVTQAGHYGATLLLADKHGLELPRNLRDDDMG